LRKRYRELSFIYLPNIEVYIAAQEAWPVACVLGLERLDLTIMTEKPYFYGFDNYG
jgi:hypothetical protein